MRLARLALVLGLLGVGALPAAAAPLARSVERSAQPSLVSLGVGQFDSKKSSHSRDSVDMRFEYRGGISLLSALSDVFKDWDNVIQFHPTVGLEATSRGQFFPHLGLAMDWHLSHHLFFTPSIAFGPYSHGNGKRLGNDFEFRTTAELGYRFSNDMRLSAYWSYLSNFGLASYDPGAHVIGAYVHVPVQTVVGLWQ